MVFNAVTHFQAVPSPGLIQSDHRGIRTVFQQESDRFFQYGMYEIRSDLCHGFQYEFPLCKTGVRNNEVGLPDYGISIEKDVQVEGSGGVGETSFAVAVILNVQTQVKQSGGCESGFKLYCQVEKPRLFCEADRFRFKVH